MDSMCSGKQHCVLRVTKIVDEEFHPCPVTVMSYLEARYECVSGMSNAK